MNSDLGTLHIDIEMESSQLLEANKQVNQQLQQTQNAANKTGNSMNKLERKAEDLGGGFNQLASAIKAYITVQAALKLIEIADDMTMLQARVARLSGSLEEAKNTMAALSTIAANTGNSLSSTEKLWETLTSSLKETGATNKQIVMLTDTLQKIGVVGGSSSEEMANALRQFGQSIAGGTVRAEEFNSIIEQMPELARQMAAGLGISVGELRKRMLEGKLSAEDALNSIQKQAENVNTEFEKMPVTVDRAKNSLDVAFKNMISDLNQSIGLTQELASMMQTVANNLNFYNKNVGDSSRMPKLIELQKQYNDELKDGQRWYETDTIFQQRRGEAASKLKQVEGEIAHIRAKAAKDAEESNKPIEIKSTSTGNSKEDDLIKKSQRRIELSKLEGEARARLQAQYDAEDAGITDSKKIKALQDEYAATERNTSARKASNAEGTKAASQAESVSQKLEALRQKSELAADSTQELSRSQAVLQAQQSLGKAATDEQIKQAGDYAAKIWDQANALRAKQQAEQATRFVNQEVAGANTTRDPYSGTVVDPTAQIAADEQRKLDALEKYQQMGAVTAQQYEDAKTAIARKASLDREQILKDENQRQYDSMNMLLGGIGDGFSGLAGIVAKSAGENSTAYKALFAVSKGFAIAQAGLNLQLAISNAMASGPFPWNLANMAQVAAAGGQMISAIGGASYGGARKNGGPVNANSMYRVGEGGKPEIFKASNGSQYMIPGDNGSVISNKDIGGGSDGGGGIQQTVQFYITTTGGIDDQTKAWIVSSMKQVALYQMKDQSTRPGGMLQARKQR